jgi:hypothetical protein
MISPRLSNHLGKVYTLAATVIANLPLLAQAQVTSAVRPVPHLPEANPGLVLIPFIAAVLLFSSRRLFGRKTLKNGA